MNRVRARNQGVKTMHRLFALMIAFLAVALFSGLLFGQAESKLSRKLQIALEENSPGAEVAAWIFFTDKGSSLSRHLTRVEASLTPNAYRRRLHSRGAGNLVDKYDLSVNAAYLGEVAARVQRIRHKSRWLNAVSVEAGSAALKDLAAFPFVEKIDLVYRRTLLLPPLEMPAESGGTASSNKMNYAKPTALDYGESYTQNSQINVPPLHDAGYSGQGVIIGMLDSGFNNLGHEALDHLHVLATRDFVNGDSIVSDQPGQMGNDDHGTYTLSTIAGYQPGQLIGPAYGASFLLAKTENVDWERHIEEDHWVAGAEWADSLGADIISSSVGYRDGFTNGEPDYGPEDMDGQTTIVSRGAAIAASRGIVVVNSAGNEGPAGATGNTLIAPADGEEVIAAGAVNSAGVRSGFSSMGPTADGRIKPDLMGMGEGVRVVSAFSLNGYTVVQGTSFSCPLIAGAAALILEANPGASNVQIIEALRETAGNAFSPNNALGWGIANAFQASEFIRNGGILPPASSKVEILQNYPNPFNSFTRFDYNLPQAGRVKITVYNVRGQKVAVLLDQFQEAGLYRGLMWQAGGLSSGVYIVVLSANGRQTGRKMVYVK